MVEKPLTHSKRKVNPDLEKMKPELRQLEEQSVPFASSPSCSELIFPGFRFTVYDFASSQRMSYYPHNEALVGPRQRSAGHSRGSSQDSSAPTGTTAVPSNAGTLVPTATVDQSRAGTPSPTPLDSQLQRMPPPLPADMQRRR